MMARYNCRVTSTTAMVATDANDAQVRGVTNHRISELWEQQRKAERLRRWCSASPLARLWVDLRDLTQSRGEYAWNVGGARESKTRPCMARNLLPAILSNCGRALRLASLYYSALKVAGLTAIARRLSSGGVILCYHNIIAGR